MLARDAALAKVAAVTMLLRAHADEVARVPTDYIMWLVERVPSWVQSRWIIVYRRVHRPEWLELQ